MDGKQLTAPYNLKIPGHRLRHYAQSILRRHPFHQTLKFPLESVSSPIRVVCISDTHNHRPEIPPGDILIHAGDLTDNGSFEEIQAGLDWLAVQPHSYKIFVAGNHDVLLDERFLDRFPERRYGSSKTVHDLVWPGNVIHLIDSSITLEIARSAVDLADRPAKHIPAVLKQKHHPSRQLKIYGSPYTPQYVLSAFQYPRTDTMFWERKIPSDADIVVTHGPPRLHLDAYSGIPRGCALLGEAIASVRPRLHVFGHIHAGYGREEVVFDSARKKYEAIFNLHYQDDGWWEWRWVWALGTMAASTIWCWVKVACLGRIRVQKRAKVTKMVNASVVAWNEENRENELENEAIVVEM